MEKKNNSHKIISLFAMTLFILLFIVSTIMLWRQSMMSTDLLIVNEITHLKKIFEQIDHDCKIVDFEHVKTYIDFLTVKQFVGSAVGSMNLVRPDAWKGPYAKKTPTIQEKQYLVVQAKDGYFIMPGDGVVLGNGRKIGVDFSINDQTEMSKLLADKNQLLSAQGPLAIKLDVGHGKIKQVLFEPLEYLK